jgi:Spy/CpxP family protein refolding chaperone
MTSLTLKRILILFSVAMNLGLFLFAVYFLVVEKADKREGRKGLHMSFYHKLDLPPEQTADIQKLVREYAEDQKKMRRENKGLEKELIDLLMEKEPDRQRLDQVLDQMASLKRRREEQTFEHLMKVRSLLTEEQAQRMFSSLLSHAEKERD